MNNRTTADTSTIPTTPSAAVNGFPAASLSTTCRAGWPAGRTSLVRRTGGRASCGAPPCLAHHAQQNPRTQLSGVHHVPDRMRLGGISVAPPSSAEGWAATSAAESVLPTCLVLGAQHHPAAHTKCCGTHCTTMGATAGLRACCRKCSGGPTTKRPHRMWSTSTPGHACIMHA
jgi:hypothetical protein